MDDNRKFSLRARAKSFAFAWAGIKQLLRTEHNARIHCLAAVIAVAAGLLFRISALHWCIIVLLIAAVFALEAVNTAVEALADRISDRKHPLLKKAKDTAAAAVLFMAIAAVIIAVIIFSHYIF